MSRHLHSVARPAVLVDATPAAPRPARRPRIGIVPRGPQPAALTATHSEAEDRAFITAVRREARARAHTQRWQGHQVPEPATAPALAELAAVAVWLMRSKPARLIVRDDASPIRQTLVHAAEFFQHRRALWLWRVVEYGTHAHRAHLGAHLEVIGPISDGLRRQIVIPWSAANATAQP